MLDEPTVRPLHLHTIESLCAELVSGRPVGVGAENNSYALKSKTSRSILAWYRNNRAKWAGNVMRGDVDAIVDAAAVEPPNLASTTGTAAHSPNRKLTLRKIEAHRFGGLHAYGTRARAPENFLFGPKQSITLFEGWNGSGKTSLLNAVIWCLTGQLLRPQRKPEDAKNEFECRIDRGSPASPEAPTYHATTPVTPLPNPKRFLPDDGQLPIDTWVELTFADDAGTTFPPVRRSQSRTLRGAISESAPNLEVLGVDPIAVQIGTTMPGLIPFIQIGSVSELGQAVAQLTGLADLVDLSKHATKVQQRLDSEFRKARKEEISNQDEAFRQSRDDLIAQIEALPSIAPPDELPDPSSNPNLEAKLKALEEHFLARKSHILEEAKTVLGDAFDPSDKAARDDLESNIGPALGQLQQLNKLPSASRLAALGALPDQQLTEAASWCDEIRREADILSDLATNPSLSSRRQLYARVSAWMEEHAHDDLSDCAVCGQSLADALDIATGRLVRDHLQEALDGDSELIGHTIASWSKTRLGQLAEVLPDALYSEVRKDLPIDPGTLIKCAIIDELFDTPAFKGSLAALKSGTESLCDTNLSSLPRFNNPEVKPLPSAVLESAADLDGVLRRLDRAIAFSHWRSDHHDAVKQVATSILGTKNERPDSVSQASPLNARLAALDQTVKSAAPITLALTLCGRMSRTLSARRGNEKRLAAYDETIGGLTEVIALGTLAEKQVEGLRTSLHNRALHWRSRFYSSAYVSAGHDLVDTNMDSKGTLNILVGSHGAAAPAQHIANASALRASLIGFFMAFWEHVLEVRGGLRLLALDDPQEMLDDDNRDRLARAFPEFVEAGAQLLVTTHDRHFARMVVAEGRKKQQVEHRSVHPVNAARSTVETAPAIEELDRRRLEFERRIDDTAKAQEYASEARIFIEARLADLFDNPAYPAFSSSTKAPTFSDHLNRLRGLVGAPPNELFRSRLVGDFCNDPALAEGAPCLILLNTAHHNKGAITFKQVWDVRDDLKRLRGMVEDLHEEFRRWRWRDPTPATAADIIPLTAHLRLSFKVPIYPDLAAFTGAVPIEETQATAGDRFEGSWFEDKALFYLRNENLGFAAPSGAIAVVECNPQPGNDRNLVIAIRGSDVYARRLLRAQRAAEAGVTVALAAQTPDPRKSPPTLLLDPSQVQIHRVLGVLFDEVMPPRSNQEAVQIESAPGLSKIETAYRVREESALPLALPGQLVLGGPIIQPDKLSEYEGRLVALTLTNGSSIFKRVGASLPYTLRSLRQFQSIGGLGASEVIASEAIEGRFKGVEVIDYARLVLGVLYEG